MKTGINKKILTFVLVSTIFATPSAFSMKWLGWGREAQPVDVNALITAVRDAQSPAGFNTAVAKLTNAVDPKNLNQEVIALITDENENIWGKLATLAETENTTPADVASMLKASINLCMKNNSSKGDINNIVALANSLYELVTLKSQYKYQELNRNINRIFTLINSEGLKFNTNIKNNFAKIFLFSFIRTLNYEQNLPNQSTEDMLYLIYNLNAILNLIPEETRKEPENTIAGLTEILADANVNAHRRIREAQRFTTLEQVILAVRIEEINVKLQAQLAQSAQQEQNYADIRNLVNQFLALLINAHNQQIINTNKNAFLSLLNAENGVIATIYNAYQTLAEQYTPKAVQAKIIMQSIIRVLKGQPFNFQLAPSTDLIISKIPRDILELKEKLGEEKNIQLKLSGVKINDTPDVNQHITAIIEQLTTAISITTYFVLSDSVIKNAAQFLQKYPNDTNAQQLLQSLKEAAKENLPANWVPAEWVS